MGSIVNWTIAAGLVIALGLVGWWVKLKVDRAYEADALEAQLQQANDTITIYRTNLNRAITESDRLAKELIEKDAKAKAKIEAIQRDVVKLVPKDRSCDYGPGVTRMLNEARGHSAN